MTTAHESASGKEGLADLDDDQGPIGLSVRHGESPAAHRMSATLLTAELGEHYLMTVRGAGRSRS